MKTFAKVFAAVELLILVIWACCGDYADSKLLYMR